MLGFLAIFWTSFLIGFSGALVPGPVLTVTVKEAAIRGVRAGPLVVLGHGLAEIGITIALILGISVFLKDQRIKALVASAGGVFLIFMGISMLHGLKSLSEAQGMVNAKEIRDPGKPILLGITTTLSNPYWLGWWGSIGATLLVASSSIGHLGIVAFFSGHISSDLVWYTLVSYFVSLGLSYRNVLWYKITYLVCGVFLIMVGSLFMRYGIKLAVTG